MAIGAYMLQRIRLTRGCWHSADFNNNNISYTKHYMPPLR